MEGICSCGGRIKENNHKVLTDKGYSAWKHHAKTDLALPVKIQQSTCQSCGRNDIRIESC